MPTLNINHAQGLLKQAFDNYLKFPDEIKILKYSEDEISLLKSMRVLVKRIEVGFNSGFIISFGDLVCLCVVGSIVPINEEWIKELPVDRMLFLPMLEFGEIRLKSTVTSDEVEQHISPALLGEDIDFDVLMSMFDEVHVYQLYDIIPKEVDIRTLLIRWTFSDPAQHILDFSDNLTEEFQKFIEDEHFDEFILNAYLSNQWHQCFFELYRCLEPFFNNLYARLLKDDLNIEGKTHEDIANVFRNNRLTIPDEKSTISELFKRYLSEPEHECFVKLFCIQKMPSDEVSRATVGRRIYSLRGAIVHHPLSSTSKKDVQESGVDYKKFKTETWDTLCLTMLRTVRHFWNTLY